MKSYLIPTEPGSRAIEVDIPTNAGALPGVAIWQNRAFVFKGVTSEGAIFRESTMFVVDAVQRAPA